MMRAKSRIIIYHFTNTNIFSHRIHQQKITVCVCLHMVCVDVIISQDIFLYSMNKYCSCMHEKKKRKKRDFKHGRNFTFGREDAISNMGLAEASSGDKLKVSRSSL